MDGQRGNTRPYQIVFRCQDKGVHQMPQTFDQAVAIIQAGLRIPTNLAFQRAVLADPAFAAGGVDTGFIARFLDAAKAAEIIELLAELNGPPSTGHHYVEDIATPAPTIVLSRNEYLDMRPAEATFPHVA